VVSDGSDVLCERVTHQPGGATIARQAVGRPVARRPTRCLLLNCARRYSALPAIAHAIRVRFLIVLVSVLLSDVGVKEYLVWLDQSGAVESFVLREVDDKHLFVVDRPNLFEELQAFLDAWHDANSFSAAQQQAVSAAQTQASLAHLPPAARRQRQQE